MVYLDNSEACSGGGGNMTENRLGVRLIRVEDGSEMKDFEDYVGEG